MAEHYGSDYDKGIAAAGDDPRRWVGRREVLSRYKTGGAILDLGCSAGGFLASLNGESWRLFGVEMSKTAASEARRRCGAQVFVGDALDASFAPESFDAITCFHVLEHLYEPKAILARVFSWLKPGGIFYVMVPNIDSGAVRLFGSFWYGLELPRHLWHFSPVSLRNLAGSAGLQALSISTHREVLFEASTRYVADEALRAIGIKRGPLAHAGKPSVPWRAIRKAFRLTALPVLSLCISFLGNGESIHALFLKPDRC